MNPKWTEEVGEFFSGYASHQDQVIVKPDNAFSVYGSIFCPHSILCYDDTENPIQMNQEWLSLYKATTHLSMICDTYLRSRQNLMQEDGSDLLMEQEWNADMLDPFVLKDYLTDLGYSTPPELQKEVDEFEKEKDKGVKTADNVIQLFPEKT